MRYLQIGATLGVSILCVSLVHAGAAPENSAQLGRQPAAACRDASLRASLLDREVPVDSSIRVEVGRAEIEAPLPPGERRVRVGVTKGVDARVEFSSLRPQHLTATPRAVSQGAIRGNGSGGFVWTGVVESPGAMALRLRLVSFFLPRNGELYLYSDRGEVFGPYTGRGPNGSGEFWSHTLQGSRVTLQLAYNGTDTARALRAARFVVADVGHLDRSVFATGPTGDESASNLCTFNEDCVVDAETATGRIPADVALAQDAVAAILFVSGRYLFVCSGGLLADTDEASQRPLFLTANHCVSKGREANTLEAFFGFTKSVDGCDLDAVSGDRRTLGSSILVTGRQGDYSLLELAEPAPSGSAFLPWNQDPVAFTNGTPLYRISHPAGAPQAYSEQEVDVSRPTCTSWPRGERIYSSDIFGATEGGSSGSPVLNAAGEVVGQLSGACGYNVNDPCDAVLNATVDGALAQYFSNVESVLDPITSCIDSDGDGYCANVDDCNDGDAATHPGALEICDGIDNNCDGRVDEGCGTGCDLGQPGQSCTSPDQCCSNKCKGKPGSRTCR